MKILYLGEERDVDMNHLEDLCNQGSDSFKLYCVKSQKVYCGVSCVENVVHCDYRANLPDRTGLFPCMELNANHKVRELYRCSGGKDGDKE